MREEAHRIILEELKGTGAIKALTACVLNEIKDED